MYESYRRERPYRQSSDRSLARGNTEEAAFYVFAMIPFGNIIRRGAGPLSDGLGRLARSGVDGATTVATKLVKNIPVVGPWATKRVICPTRRAVGLPGCFVAGTPVLTPEGSKPIEQLRPGDLVLSRSEFDVDAPVEARMVEEVFVRLSPTVDLHVGEQVIRTTTEHPIYVLGKGWVNVSLLEAGDILLSHDGQQLTLREVRPTGDYEVVYNFCVEAHHTYFVGCDEWGFSVWAHNSFCGYDEQGRKIFRNDEEHLLEGELRLANALGIKPVQATDPKFVQYALEAEGGKLLWVRRLDGEVVFVPERVTEGGLSYRLNHTAASGGEDVLGAGEAYTYVARNGRVTIRVFNNGSGHYSPSGDVVIPAAEVIKHRGIGIIREMQIPGS